MAKQRIVLVDDHEVDRLGLKSLLERHPQFEVVGEAADGVEAVQKALALQPDVVLLDMVMPVMNGEEFFRNLRLERHSTVPVIFSSVDETRAEPLKSIGHLDGIFLKGRPSGELVELINRTLS